MSKILREVKELKRKDLREGEGKKFKGE